MTEKTEQEKVRWAKLAQLREQGFKFPNDVKVTAYAHDIQKIEQFSEPASAQRFTTAGRITQIRMMGKAAFCNILDTTDKLQLYIKKDIIGEEQFNSFTEFDIGDIIEVKGYPFVTKTGEKSLFVENVRLLVKCLTPLPEKWHGLTDIEARYRQRYVDLIANPSARDVFRSRAKIVSFIRNYFDSRNFIEVETPVLQYQVGGANAKPFHTHYNALGTDMILRIAPELCLKKLTVGGLDNVYEFARNFRNEGLSRKHNPEFTMLEFYRAYATYEDNMNLTEEMISEMVQAIHGKYEIEFDGKMVNFQKPWKRISMVDSLKEIGGVDASVDLNSLSSAQNCAAKLKIKLSDAKVWGKVIEDLWGELVEPKLVNPTFITHHPFDISPLARKNDHNPNLTDRFELIVAGMEIANGYSELNDAEDQRERFLEQVSRKEGGDEDACDLDEDFIKALEYGLPPTSGEGIGIDRLTMLLTNSTSIRDVILFPQLKPL